MNHYPRHIGDILTATVGLSLAERGAYDALIDQYYAREAPLPKDRREVYRLAAAATPAERKAVDYVLGRYFTEQDDGWHQRRCDEEIEKYRAKSAKASESAAARWGARDPGDVRTHTGGGSERNANASGTGMRTHSEGNASHKPEAKNQQPLSDSSLRSESAPGAPPKVPTDPVKEEIWRTGRELLVGEGMSRDRAGGLMGKLCKEYGQVLVLEAVRDCAKATPAKPSEWLVARCQERRKPVNRQAALESRNAAVAATWQAPEDEHAAH